MPTSARTSPDDGSGDDTAAVVTIIRRCDARADRDRPRRPDGAGDEFRDTTGRKLVVELCAAEVRDLRGDADKLLNADERTVANGGRS